MIVPPGSIMLRILDRLEETLIATLIAAATILIFIAVVHRYAFGIPVLHPYMAAIHLSWAQELCIYMFVWMAKFGAAYGVRTGIHVGVDVAIARVDKRSYHRIVLFGLLCGALFTGVIGSFGARFVWLMAQTDQVTPDLELPAWIVYLAIPCGSYLMCFRFLQVAYAFARTGELPHHDAAQIEGIEPEHTVIPGAALATR
jgi:C4-dicarboxylate transporter, DctQ subunit